MAKAVRVIIAESVVNWPVVANWDYSGIKFKCCADGVVFA